MDKYKKIFMAMDLDFEGYCALKRLEKKEQYEQKRKGFNINKTLANCVQKICNFKKGANCKRY